jgi:hypothetical protein
MIYLDFSVFFAFVKTKNLYILSGEHRSRAQDDVRTLKYVILTVVTHLYAGKRLE